MWLYFALALWVLIGKKNPQYEIGACIFSETTNGGGGYLLDTGGNEPPCQCWRHKRCRFHPWVGKIPWRRAWQLTPVSLPGESHGQRSLADYRPSGLKEPDRTKATWHLVDTHEIKSSQSACLLTAPASFYQQLETSAVSAFSRLDAQLCGLLSHSCSPSNSAEILRSLPPCLKPLDFSVLSLSISTAPRFPPQSVPTSLRIWAQLP